MNKNDLFDSLSRIDDDLIARSNQKDKYKKEDKKMSAKSVFLKRVLPVAASLAIVIATIFGIQNLHTNKILSSNNDSPKVSFMKYSVAQPDIPEQIQLNYDYNSEQSSAYYEQNGNRITSNRIDKADFSRFLNSTAQVFLSGQDNKNKVYSPVNVYIALSMLASCTDGNTQRQILDVLGADSEASARQIATKLLKGNYVDNGSKKSLLTNSIWTGSKYNLNKNFLLEFSQSYYAPVFTGDPSEKKYSEALQKWLKSASGHLLDDAANDIEFDKEMALTLVSTLYYSANWDSEFLEENNTDGVFRSPEGEQNCTFMNQNSYGTYIKRDSFSAVTKQISSGGYMYFILPDEGVAPETIIGSEDLTDMLCIDNIFDEGVADINLSVPKFDISSDLDLKNQLISLGMTDAFDFAKADYSPVSEDELFLSKIQHSARVAIDEKGVTAAAFTVEMANGMGMLNETVDFTLDRPFVFAITGDTGDVMFIGIVNQI